MPNIMFAEHNFLICTEQVTIFNLARLRAEVLFVIVDVRLAYKAVAAGSGIVA